MIEYIAISVLKELAARVDNTVEGTTFSGVSDLVRFPLRSIVIQYECSGGDPLKAESQEITE